MKRATGISGVRRLLLLLGLVLLLGGVAVLAVCGRSPTERGPVAKVASPVSAPVASKKPAATTQVAWGEAVNGLRAGLSAKRPNFVYGDPIPLTLHLRNDGKERQEVPGYKFLWWYSWKLVFTPAGGAPLHAQPRVPMPSLKPPMNFVLAPGEEKALPLRNYLSDLRFAPPGNAAGDVPLPPGRYTVQARFVSVGQKEDEFPTSTGPVEIEILPSGAAVAKPASPKPASPKPAIVKSVTPKPPATVKPASPTPAYTLDPNRPDSRVEGYAPLPRGGAGGRVVEVTSLHDSGPGTFRAALDNVNKKGGPAQIVFRVGGTIRATSPLYLRASRVTVDGSTAPAPGITISGRDLMKYLFDENGYLTRPIPKLGPSKVKRFRPGAIRTMRGPLFALQGVTDVIVRDLRFRDTPSHQIINSGGTKNVLFDHISSTECGDGAMFINRGCKNFTIAWSLFAGSNLCIRTRGNPVSFHHNLFTENALRHPLVRGGGVRDMRNNVTLTWRIAGIQTHAGENSRLNLINNFYGPSASGKPPTRIVDATPDTRVYASGNVGPGNYDVNRRKGNVARPFAEPAVTTQSAAEAKVLVLKYAGARPRDAIDRGYAAGTRKYARIWKEEWRMENAWWKTEEPPPPPTYDPYPTKRPGE